MAYPFAPVTHLTQFYMKLEEKMHAKEAEINQIQAKTQVCRNIKLINFYFYFLFIKVVFGNRL